MAETDVPPLGATPDRHGVQFALFSREAEAVELCLFEADGRRETGRYRLSQRDGDVWHDFLPGLRPGQAYGYRVYGPYEPNSGLRFNPHKLLVDPYARALVGRFVWDDSVFGYTPGHPLGDLSFDPRDSAPHVPKAIVTVAPPPTVSRRPETPWRESLIYELHVKGFTKRHPDMPQPLRGTAEALTQPVVVDHLRDLGVTAVELLPVQEFVSEVELVRRGLVNYWGYNTFAFFVPDRDHLAFSGIGSLARITDAFHDAGIEVILDIVFNHTAEGNETGPTVSFRGIDNRAYYLLEPGAPRWYLNFSGCGNTLKAAEPAVAQLILDSLRYWTAAGGVDGFRFDLASTLLRGPTGAFDGADVLTRITQDPVLGRLKLIAEPWDATGEGYRLGDFPAGWAEWNDRYRTAVRRFWASAGGVTGELATRISGSSDMFAFRNRRPTASINYITSHDGFTLNDLVSYGDKRNHRNGEDNRDGEQQSYSINCGAEGANDDPVVTALRLRERRNRLATLLLSRGVPMLLGGDEIGQTQNGNNNPYCQDNETTWLDWNARSAPERDLRGFIARLISLRRSLPVLTEDDYVPTSAGNEEDGYRLSWLTPDGGEMSDIDWHYPDAHVLICLLTATRERNGLILAMNAFEGAMEFRLPGGVAGWWRRVVDTASPTGFPEGVLHVGGETTRVAARALVLFVAEPESVA
jgi:glycogen operon protein